MRGKEAVRAGALLVLLACAAACGTERRPSPERQSAPSSDLAAVLLITLDTTRADRLGYEFGGVRTPHLDRLAREGLVFGQAYSTAPTTLPAHASMLTGLYPSEHGVHENARYLPDRFERLATRFQRQGFATAALVSGYPLAREFGLARGFDVYDDDFPGNGAERRAGATTAAAKDYLGKHQNEKLFLWVHYYDPHFPYAPPEPFRSEYEKEPYLGEIAFMDHALGDLLRAFEERFQGRPTRVVVVGDHGEGLGEHGEKFHGHLLYQGALRVPLILHGSGIEAGTWEKPVSVRDVFHTLSGWLSDSDRLWDDTNTPVVLAEAMKPFLEYGWQPQVMAVTERYKLIRSGELEVYDLAADPGESRNLAGRVRPNPATLAALEAYAPPSAERAGKELSREQLEKLASLGYASTATDIQPGRRAVSAKDMAHLFDALDRGSELFVRREYGAALALFKEILQEDPQNFTVRLRAAVAHSLLGDEAAALAGFERAGYLQPDSIDLRHYLGMHYLRLGEWDKAAPQLVHVLERMPNKLAALEGLAKIREREGRIEEAIGFYRRAAELRDRTALFVKLGNLYMSRQRTAETIWAFENALRTGAEGFGQHLELGVCYLVSRRYAEAASLLDRVPPDHPGYAMALFKRAQASVLLNEPERAERVAAALARAGGELREMVLRDSLLQPYLP